MTDLKNNIEYEGQDLDALACLKNYQNWILDYFRPHLHGNVLEIGSGIGTYSKLILPHVENLDCIEPDGRQAEHMKKNFVEHKNINVFNSMAEDFFAEQQPKATYDAIVMINVLEHIEDDAAMLQSMHKALKPNGKILIFVPALQWLFSELDTQVGHYRRYHLAPMRKLVTEQGFNINTAKYFDMLGVAPWWLLNKQLKATEVNPSMALLADKTQIPLTRFVEFIIRRPPLGKNVILIAEKPGTTQA